MAGKTIALSGVICAMLMLGACMGTPMVFDESVPLEKSAHLFFENGLEVTSFNGIPVPTRRDPLLHAGIYSEWHNIVLPAGEMEFTLDVGIERGDAIYRGKDLTFKYAFEPTGDLLCYRIVFTATAGAENIERGGGGSGNNEREIRSAGNNERGVLIYKQLTRELTYKRENLLAFVPFS